MRSLRLITPLAAVLLSAAAVRAQTLPTAPSPPRDIAIRNARIVQAAGRVVEGGTIVLKNGLITAVGANVAIPAGAWVIDGAGMTVYPGLVNALSAVGLPAALKLPPRARAQGAQGLRLKSLQQARFKPDFQHSPTGMAGPHQMLLR